MTTTTLTDIIWKPTGDYLSCRVTDYMRSVGIKDVSELVRASGEDIEWFWTTALEYCGVDWHKPYDQLLDESKGFPWAKWFVGGEMNIVSNCLDYHVRNKGKVYPNRPPVGADHLAIIWESEDGEKRKLTYGELDILSSKVAQALKKLNVNAGDSVGIYMPMVPEVVAVLFGCLKIGAVAIPIFSGFGAHALADRLSDAEAKVLFTADAGKRRGKTIPVKKDVDEAASSLPALKHVVVMDRFGMAENWVDGRDIKWSEVVEKAEPLTQTVALPAEHPSMYLYTSGTTGKPKGTVHTHAGALASIARELGFAFDVRSTDVFFWFTDIGWMMGPWEMIGVTFWGGTMVIYEGAPNFPAADQVWQVIERNNVTTLGISPTLIRVLRTAGDEMVQKYKMPTLRLLGSTGEPWDLDSYMWFFENVGKKRVPIINISGGTELVGCLLQPLPNMPLKPCTLGGPGLGMASDVVDEKGESIRNGIGHLVCRRPSPSMTKGFLKDPDRYLDTYFSKFPDMWYHGDWAKVDEDGFWFLFGRSDDTIKIAGKRIGPGEIESILVENAKVAEAAAIGVPHAIKGEGVVCFVVTMPNVEPSEALSKELLDMVAHNLGGPLKPEAVHFVAALPKTRSGKIVRGSIRRRYLGEPAGDVSTVENPEALDLIPTAAGK